MNRDESILQLTHPDGEEIRRVDSPDAPESTALKEIEALNAEGERRWRSKLKVDSSLTRSLVSFQANKARAVYRWFKYKEAFSAGLIEVLLSRYKIAKGILLDPFAGSGTAMFAAAAQGMGAEGIELLPIGQRVIATKQLIDWELQPADVEVLCAWESPTKWKDAASRRPLNELRITKGAYPAKTVEGIERFLAQAEQENERVRSVLQFALLCTLESISYTRKDGQYLRWDYRSGRRQGKKIFNKGKILDFDTAIREKLREIVVDLKAGELPEDLFSGVRQRMPITLHSGSCLDLLQTLNAKAFDCIVTSPPYCNRYDYTRTYALELALLGVSEEELARLRQAMLSCTVENRAKDLLAINPPWTNAIAATDRQQLLQRILCRSQCVR